MNESTQQVLLYHYNTFDNIFEFKYTNIYNTNKRIELHKLHVFAMCPEKRKSSQVHCLCISYATELSYCEMLLCL